MNSLGTTSPDPVGEILQTGFRRFQSPFGIDGLYRAANGRLDLLAVATDVKGTGRFRNFITAIKSERTHVRVLHVANKNLADALARYGFVPFEDVETINGDVEFITGMEWENKPEKV